MRVIAGTARGARLLVAKSRQLRPTGDRARETLFNVLADEVVGRLALDLFAGTGSLGIEALSRGATQAVFVERHRRTVDALVRNLASCHLEEGARVLPLDWRKALTLLAREMAGFDLIFADPPYEAADGEDALIRLVELGLATPGALAVLEHRRGTARVPARWSERRRLEVGDTGFLLLERVSTASSPC